MNLAKNVFTLTMMLIFSVFILTSCEFANSGGIKLVDGLDLPGNDYKYTETKDAKECSKLCSEEEECKAFTFVKKTSSCCLKRSIGEKKTSGSCISGIK